MTIEILNIIVVLGAISLISLSVAFFNLSHELEELKKAVNDNFIAVKDDVLVLDKRTKTLRASPKETTIPAPMETWK